MIFFWKLIKKESLKSNFQKWISISISIYSVLKKKIIIIIIIKKKMKKYKIKKNKKNIYSGSLVNQDVQLLWFFVLNNSITLKTFIQILVVFKRILISPVKAFLFLQVLGGKPYTAFSSRKFLQIFQFASNVSISFNKKLPSCLRCISSTRRQTTPKYKN